MLHPNPASLYLQGMPELESADVSLLFFAKSRELAGCSQASLRLPSRCSFSQLKTSLLKAYPQLSVLQDTFILAVNQEYLDSGDSVTFRQGDEVAVIPPISGG